MFIFKTGVRRRWRSDHLSLIFKSFKMREFVLVVVILLSFANCGAQQTHLKINWNKELDVLKSIGHISSAIDSQTAVIVISSVESERGDSDVSLVKYDQNGQKLWSSIVDGGEKENDFSVGLVINEWDEIFVLCSMSTKNSFDISVLKYSNTGSLIWSYNWDGDGFVDLPSEFVFDEEGNIYISGGTQNASGISDIVVIKLNNLGKHQWHSKYDFAGFYDAAVSLKVRGPKLVIACVSASVFSNLQWLILDFDKGNGNILQKFRTPLISSGKDYPVSLSFDNMGNAYVIGNIRVNDRWDIQTIKLDNSFNVAWSRIFNGGQNDLANDVGMDSLGNIYILGTSKNLNFGAQFITLKYNSKGEVVWQKSYGRKDNTKIAYARDLLVDANGHTFITGNMSDPFTSFLTIIGYDEMGSLKFEHEAREIGNFVEVQAMVKNDSIICVSGNSELEKIKRAFIAKYSFSKITEENNTKED